MPGRTMANSSMKRHIVITAVGEHGFDGEVDKAIATIQARFPDTVFWVIPPAEVRTQNGRTDIRMKSLSIEE